jgi:hypothetical protein
VGPTAWDIVVEPSGAPHVIWNDARSFGCGGAGVYPFAMRSHKNGASWVTAFVSGGWLENNGEESKHVAGVVDGAHFAQAYVTNGLRVPHLASTNPAGVSGELFKEGEASGQIVLAKPPGLPIFALFSGWWYDEFGPDPTLDSVILTEDVAQPKQPNSKTTLLSCPGERASAHALAVNSTGVVRAAWVSETGLARYATNAGGTWSYHDLGPATGVEVVVTAAGQLHVFLGQGGDIHQWTPCNQ